MDTDPASLWGWAQTHDGQTLSRHGESPLAELPLDPDCVLVVPVHRLSWHTVTLPKVNPSRLRATLDGLLEDRVLDDLTALQLALAPGFRPGIGQSVWVAMCHKPWLQACLQTLEQAQRVVTRIIPAAAPTATDSTVALHTQRGQPWSVVSSPQGVLTLPLPATELNTACAPQALRTWLHAVTGLSDPETTRAMAEPSYLANAEQFWPEWRWTPAPTAQAWLQPLQAGWNLAQFDLRLPNANRHRQWLHRLFKTLCFDAAWKPLRWALLALMLVNTVGLNALAWQARHRLSTQQADMRTLLTQTFPHVRLVLDAPLQMQRELDSLRQQQGQLGNADLESLLRTLASADTSAATFQSLTFSAGQAQLKGWTLPAESQVAVQAVVSAQGWQGQPVSKDWTLSWKVRP